MTILAIDLGTSAVKAIVWDHESGVVARGQAPVLTTHPHPGFDEQDADDWWSAVQSALSTLPLDDISGVGLSSQRETFVCLDATARPLRPAILWSDGRAPSPQGRWDWVAAHEPDVALGTRWLAAPKDYVLQKLVGCLVTDATLASRTNLPWSKLPDIVEPRTIIAEFRGTPVVAGAGDRACEVFAVNASPARPMVSWGTTANCSLPLGGGAAPEGWRASMSVDGAQLVEAGLSAAGAALGWLSGMTATTPEQLTELAADVPPGANGVVVLPWLNGARAPWWRPDARATILGETASTTPGELARAVYEGVAHDLRRAIGQLPEQPRVLLLAGGGARHVVWQQVLSGVTGLPLSVYGADAAAIGAALLTLPADTEVRLTPVAHIEPDDAVVARYAELAELHNAAALDVLGSSS